MPTSAKPRVCFVTLILTHYRVQFHERVHAMLAADGIDYRLIYGAPSGDAATRSDTVDLAWATRVDARPIRVFGRDLHWQPVTGQTSDADLVIASQENKLLVNYWFQFRQVTGRGRFAFWGHGRNLQSRNPEGLSERVKRRLALRAHWWFAYTPGTGRFLERLGFPADRITVFNNAVDTTTLIAERDSVSPAEIETFRRDYDLGGGPIGLYIGGMYEDKRLDYLVEAACLIRERLPSFRLVMVGAGPQATIARAAAGRHPFVRYLGPRFGREKALCAAASSVFMLPAAVGLAVLDSFAYGLPMVTLAGQGHGPEIEYLEGDRNGLVLPRNATPRDYADAVTGLLADPDLHGRLVDGARTSAQSYSIETMAARFCDGVKAALGRDPSGTV
jgi:glycosyltransferase involved in cell wall biosynthesis